MLLKLFNLNYFQLHLIKTLNKNKLFQIGLLIKILLIFFITPNITSSLFLPFIRNIFTDYSIDPWHKFLINDGNINSFPYGLSMILAYLPLSFLGDLLDKYLFDINFFETGFKLSSLIFDYFLFILISLLSKNKESNILIFSYWLSPIIIYATYVHGQLDIVPISLLIFSVYFLRLNKFYLSGVFISLSLISKFSMLIALPFIYIYIIKRRGFSSEFYKFSLSIIISILIFFVPYLFSNGFWTMVLTTREFNRLYTVFIPYGNELKLYVIPVIYILSLYLVWRLKRITQDLFLISLGLGFLSIIVFLPPAPAWTLWVVPFLAYYQINSKKDLILISLIYSTSYILNTYYLFDYADFQMINRNIFIDLNNEIINQNLIKNILFTFQQGLGFLLAIRIYIYGLKKNNFYTISDNPILISISGFNYEVIRNLNLSLQNLFNKKYLNVIDPLKKTKSKFTEDNLNNKKIAYYANYMYKYINKISDEISNNKKEYILLINDENIDLNSINKKVDISININKPFNQFNINTRNISLDKKFLIFNFDNKNINNSLEINQVDYSLTTFFPLGFLHKKLFSLFIAISSLNVDIELLNDERIVKMVIEGYPSKEDIFQIAYSLMPEIEDFSLNENSWSPGYIGIMQIIIIANLLDILKNRNTN